MPMETKHPRGVFKTQYKLRGAYALIVIDSQGELRKARRLTSEISELRATEWLRQWLDRIDPVPKLVTEPRRLPESPHPCQRDDHLSFTLRTTARNMRYVPHYDPHQD